MMTRTSRESGYHNCPTPSCMRIRPMWGRRNSGYHCEVGELTALLRPPSRACSIITVSCGSLLRPNPASRGIMCMMSW